MIEVKENTILALKKSCKGQLRYDREWLKEGRSKELLKFVSQLNKINVPKGFSLVCVTDQESSFSDPNLGSSSKNHEILNSTTLKEGILDISSDKNGVSSSSEDSIVSDSSCVSETSSSSSDDDSRECFLETGHDACNDLVMYEEERKRQVDNALKERKSKIDQNGTMYLKQLTNQIELFRETLHLKQDLQQTQLKKLNESQLREMEKLKLEMKNNQRHKRLDNKIKEVEQKNIEVAERKRKEAQVNEDARKVLTQHYNTFHGITETLNVILSKCSSPQFLEVSPDERKRQLKDIQDSLLKILNNSVFTDIDFLETQKLSQMARDILGEVNQDINNAKVKEQIMLQNAIAETTSIQTSQAEIPQAEIPQVTKTESQPSTPLIETQGSGDCQTAARPVPSKNYFIELYKTLRQNHQLWENKYSDFVTNSGNKKYIFNLQKVINISLNSISTVGGKVHEKIEKLTSLLIGRSVSVGATNISMRENPAAIYFCADIIAKKFVHLAEVQVSSKHTDAFPLAAVAISLWSQFPKLGELILFHLYDRCPYLRPGSIMMPKDKNDTNGFFKTLGYIFNDDKPEEDEEFVKRMSGIVRFYAAILITLPSPSHRRDFDPYGLQHGWRFMSMLLTTEPWEGVTSTLLLDFLEICGHDLFKIYNKQFKKILYILCKDYFQILKKQETMDGALTRLEMFLHATLRTGNIPIPQGLLEESFWYSSQRY